MRSIFFLSAALCALVACDSESSDVGANPAAGSAGQSAGGSAGSTAGGSAGQAQAGASGQSTGGTAGSGTEGGAAGAGAQGGGAGAGAEGGAAGQAQAGAAGEAGAAGQAGSGGSAGAVTFDTLRSDLPRDDGSQVGESDRSAVVSGNNAFALDLYQQLRNDPSYAGKNIWFSPISVTLALGMTSSGAQGATLSELSKAMHFTLPQESLHPALNWLSLELGKRPEQAKTYAKQSGADNVPDTTLNIVNAVWGEKTVTWKPTFLDVLARSYGAGVNLGDFKNDPEKERLIINDWVAEQTQQRILDLLAPDSVTQDTRAVLVNAVNFTFPWDTPFKSENTKPASFSVDGGAAITIDTMANTLHASYAEDDLAQSASLDLFSNSMSLVVYVPKEGKFAEFESKLDTELPALQAAAQPFALDLTLPKFKYTTPSQPLTDALVNLGMKTPFTGAADFSGMTASEPIHISKVQHKAMVGVDEVGVQAAAATAVSLDGGGQPPPPQTLHVDRSFLLAIRDNSTGTLLFFGRIVNPSE